MLLAQTLSKSPLSPQEPFYVRCIKPNEDKVAGKLDENHCRHQVAYLGLLENVRVRRAGFASRQPYSRFLLRYWYLTPITPWAVVRVWSPRGRSRGSPVSTSQTSIQAGTSTLLASRHQNIWENMCVSTRMWGHTGGNMGMRAV